MISRSNIVSITNSGIGNRLKSLLSVMRMTNNYKVYWPKNRWGHSSFSELFKNDVEVTKFPFLNNIFFGQNRLIISKKVRLSPYFLVVDSDKIDYDFAPSYYDKKTESSRQINNGKSIDYQYERIPLKIRESYIHQVKKLVPIDYIENKVNEFSKKAFNNDTVSVQLRTWKDDVRRKEMFNKEEYFEYLDKLNNNNFFLSADCQEIIDEIIERYPGRAFYYPKRINSYDPGSEDSKSVEFMQDCLIDMLLIGKNPLIIGSHLSSFVECAWWFGLCKPNVVILNQGK